MIQSLCVFCGASLGNRPDFSDVAFSVGRWMALNNIQLVYGGGGIGLMGKLADGALSENGKVIGVIPRFLKKKEIAHAQLNELIVTETMHERKIKMHQLSDAAIALPGGFGTLDELFELLTWLQLGLHNKPVGILNYNGYFNSLLQFLNDMHATEFITSQHLQLLTVKSEITTLLDAMNLRIKPQPHNGAAQGA